MTTVSDEWKEQWRALLPLVSHLPDTSRTTTLLRCLLRRSWARQHSAWQQEAHRAGVGPSSGRQAPDANLAALYHVLSLQDEHSKAEWSAAGASTLISSWFRGVSSQPDLAVALPIDS